MGSSVASEPLNLFIIVICELWPTYGFLIHFLTLLLDMVALTSLQIYLMILLNIYHKSCYISHCGNQLQNHLVFVVAK